MKFVFITPMFAPSYAYGGPPRSSLGLARGLLACGHDVRVVTANGNGDADLVDIPPGAWTSFEGVPVNYLKRLGRGNYLFTPGLGRELERLAGGFDCAIFKATWTYFNWAGTGVIRKKGIPYLEFVVGTFDDWAMQHHSTRKRVYWKLIEETCYRRSAGIIALSENEQAQVRKMGLEQPVEVIPNGVDLQEFAAGALPAEAYFPELKGRRYLLFMGRLHLKKGIENLIRAFAVIHADFPGVTLVIAGSGEPLYEAGLRTRVSGLHLDDAVIFPGWVSGERRVALLKSASCFVLPSFSEGLPMGVLDAMACRVPVVITPECYLPDVERHHAGFIVSNRPEDLAGKIRALLGDEVLRVEMGANAFSLVEQQHSWASVAGRVAAFAQKVS